MPGTRVGWTKAAAARRGMTIEEYQGRLDAGEKWCSKGKHWAPRLTFGKDRQRDDGLASSCLSCRHVQVPKVMKGNKPNPMKGKSYPPEVRAHMGIKKGTPNPRKGLPRSPEERARISAALRASPRLRRGDGCHSFKDGKVEERRGLRFTKDYKRWRFDVFLRDRFTCQRCGDNRGGNLIAHHIRSFTDFPASRLDVANGRTLCKPCHIATHATT